MVDQVERIVAEEVIEQTVDTSDPIEVNKARKKESRTRADRLHFVQAAMTTEQGRAWFYDLLLFTKVIKTPFDEDPYRTAFNCGQQNIGLRVLSDIQTAAPDEYLVMISENKTKNG